MNFGNINLIIMGAVVIVGTTIIHLIKLKTSFCNEKYFNKLESAYGNIDRRRTVKLEVLYRYVIGLEYIAIGLFTRRLDITILVIILVGIITVIFYYLIRKKYITI